MRLAPESIKSCGLKRLAPQEGILTQMGKSIICTFFSIVIFVFSFSSASTSVTQNSNPSAAMEAFSPEDKADTLVRSMTMQRDYKIPDAPGQTPATQSDSLKVTPWKGSKLVVIDAGHGGNDPGSRSDYQYEKDVTLDISLRLNKILLDSDVKTYMIRTEDVFIPHKDRILTANDKNAALYISIHNDWFRNPSLNGVSTLYFPSRELSAGYLNEIEYARVIQKELSAMSDMNNRGLTDRPDLAVLRHAKMPSVLVELGFLSNKNDSELLNSETFRQKAAEALSDGIRKSLIKITVSSD